MEKVGKALETVELHLTAKAEHPISDALDALLATLNSIRLTFNAVMPRMAKWLSTEYEKHGKVLDKFSPEDTGDSTKLVAQSTHDVADALASLRAVSDLMGTQVVRTLQRSLFTQVFCEFDSFIGALLAGIYTRKTGLLKGISREISLTDLLEFDSLDAVKQNMLSKEIETFRRDSYVEQFAALERKFGFKTLRQFKEWGDFVELSQRRNILIHNGGLVNEQYLLVCDREGYTFSNRPKVGDILEPDADYISHAIKVVSLVGFMLAHTLWRKIFPDEIEKADVATNDAIFKLLEQKRWQTAMAVSEFALSEQMRKSLTEMDLRIRIVNCAIALKFSDKTVDAKKLLDSIDWSASYRDFRLARAVLLDEFEEACELMLSIGRTGEIFNQLAYHQFPLFHKFREYAGFQAMYEEIYGESFVRKVMEQAKDVSAEMTQRKEAMDDVADVVVASTKTKSVKVTAKRSRSRSKSPGANTNGLNKDLSSRGV